MTFTQSKAFCFTQGGFGGESWNALDALTIKAETEAEAIAKYLAYSKNDQQSIDEVNTFLKYRDANNDSLWIEETFIIE